MYLVCTRVYQKLFAFLNNYRLTDLSRDRQEVRSSRSNEIPFEETSGLLNKAGEPEELQAAAT